MMVYEIGAIAAAMLLGACTSDRTTSTGMATAPLRRRPWRSSSSGPC